MKLTRLPRSLTSVLPEPKITHGNCRRTTSGGLPMRLLVLEGVFDVLASLLQVACHLVTFALHLE